MPKRPRSPERGVAYLKKALTLNPLEQADSILSLRNRYLGVKPAAVASVPGRFDLQEEREEITARINAVRERFWKMTLEELNGALDGLNLKPYPDLRIAVRKLRKAGVARPQFPQLARSRACDEDLFAAFKRVVVLPPREAGPLKDGIIHAAAAGPVRRRRFRKMIRRMQREFPDLYDLEEEWLDLVATAR